MPFQQLILFRNILVRFLLVLPMTAAMIFCHFVNLLSFTSTWGPPLVQSPLLRIQIVQMFNLTTKICTSWLCYVVKLYYRGSPDSTNFGFQDSRVIRGIMLIGDWFSTKTREIDKLDFQSPPFYLHTDFIFSLKTMLFCSESNT